jgi:hypothetical protein
LLLQSRPYNAFDRCYESTRIIIAEKYPSVRHYNQSVSNKAC